MNPYIGFLHAEDKGNPALINDLVEEFRTIIDSLALYMLNKGILRNKDFYYYKDRPGCFLTDKARKTFLTVFERRMWENAVDQETGKAMNIRRGTWNTRCTSSRRYLKGSARCTNHTGSADNAEDNAEHPRKCLNSTLRCYSVKEYGRQASDGLSANYLTNDSNWRYSC